MQVLQKKFDDFQHEISASTERYSGINTLARKLVAEGHSDTVLIKEKQDAVRYIQGPTTCSCQDYLSMTVISILGG